MIRIVWIDPDIVKVAVRTAGNVAEALATVLAHNQASACLVDLVLVLGIDDQVGKIKWPPNHTLTPVESGPSPAPVIRAVQAVLGRFGLDEGIDNAGFRRCCRDGQTAPRFWWKPFGRFLAELGPGRSTVCRFEEAAAARRLGTVAARAECPTPAPEVPQACVNCLGVLRIERHGGAACGEIRAVQDLRPGLAGVRGLVQASLITVAPELSQRADIDNGRVGRVDDDLADAFGFLQSHVGPVVAAVG